MENNGKTAYCPGCLSIRLTAPVPSPRLCFLGFYAEKKTGETPHTHTPCAGALLLGRVHHPQCARGCPRGETHTKSKHVLLPEKPGRSLDELGGKCEILQPCQGRFRRERPWGPPRMDIPVLSFCCCLSPQQIPRWQTFCSNPISLVPYGGG